MLSWFFLFQNTKSVSLHGYVVRTFSKHGPTSPIPLCFGRFSTMESNHWIQHAITAVACSSNAMVRARLFGRGVIRRLVKTARAMQVLHWIQRNEPPFILVSFYFFQHLVCIGGFPPYFPSLNP